MNQLIALLTENYFVFTLASSAAISAIFQGLFEDFTKSKKLKTKDELSGNDKWITFVNGVLAFLTLYILMCVFIVLIYAMKKVGKDKDLIGAYFKSFIFYYIKNNKFELCIVPVFVGVFAKLTTSNRTFISMFFRAVVAIVLAVLLLVSPSLLDFGTYSTLPMETEILTELRTMMFPYDGMLHNIDHFYSSMNNGYWIEGQPQEQENSLEQEEVTDYYQNLFSRKISELSFDEALQCVIYYYSMGAHGDALPYLDHCYEIYEQLDPARANYNNSVGLMFYYMGALINSTHYITAAENFLMVDEYLNAGYCFRNMYYETHNIDQAKDTLDLYIQQIRKVYFDDYNDNNYSAAVEAFIDFYIVIYKDGITSLSYMLSDVCQDTDNAFLNTLDISNCIMNLSDENKDSECEKLLDRIDRILLNDKYKDCPKLNIMQRICMFYSGISFSCGELCDLYSTNPEYFEDEDRINLVWLLYESGEFIKTREISKDNSFLEINDETADISLVLKAESYLQDDDISYEVDELQLYNDLTDALKRRGFIEQTGDDRDESKNDLESDIKAEQNKNENVNEVSNGSKITDQVTARLRLAQCIMAGRIGIDASYSGLSEICEELFNEDSKTGLYIIASLAYQDRDYDGTKNMCKRIVKMEIPHDSFYNRVIFLESDALIGLAKGTTDAEKKNDYYNEAATLLNDVVGEVGNDYMIALDRLQKVYEIMGQGDKAKEVENKKVELWR